MNELLAAVRQAINDSEGAAGNPDHLLDVQAQAAVEAMTRLGYVPSYGWEYGIRLGDVIVEAGFNTEGQARAWLETNGDDGHVLERRRVGVWETI